MNIMKLRRENGAVCPECRSPDYLQFSDPDLSSASKPNFECGSCGKIWQSGYDGRIYSELANKIKVNTVCKLSSKKLKLYMKSSYLKK